MARSTMTCWDGTLVKLDMGAKKPWSKFLVKKAMISCSVLTYMVEPTFLPKY